MRTTLNLDATLLSTAMRVTGISEPAAVAHAGLALLVRRKSAERLAALGGSDPDATSAPRRRPAAPKPRKRNA